jgi:hypothetical protein
MQLSLKILGFKRNIDVLGGADVAQEYSIVTKWNLMTIRSQLLIETNHNDWFWRFVRLISTLSFFHLHELTNKNHLKVKSSNGSLF